MSSSSRRAMRVTRHAKRYRPGSGPPGAAEQRAFAMVRAGLRARRGSTILLGLIFGPLPRLPSRGGGRAGEVSGTHSQRRGDPPMALYMYQAAYTAESMAAQIKEPQDRVEAVRPALEALGAKILASGYPLGEYDVLVVYEAPDDTAAASFAMAVAAGGAVRSAKTTRLLSGQEWTESLRKAQGSQYRPAR